ncbi:WD40-repeat-containing domain protein [Suillus subluteus]|nr:WD40-repeat-containing domain protein [Suillus subluteus]
MTWIATGGRDRPSGGEPDRPSGGQPAAIHIWDAKTGKLVTTLKGHMDSVRCLAWTKDGKKLISGSYDNSVRTWDTTKWEQTAVLVEHTNIVFAIAISPNGRILASASQDKTARLWNLDNGQPISSPLQHAEQVNCVSFSADGKLLATGCDDKNAYSWDVAAIVREAGLHELLSHSKANKSALHANATRPPVQQRPPAGRVPHGFFDGVPPAHRHKKPHFLDAYSIAAPPARNIFKRRGQSGEEIELQGRSSADVEVPYAKGKRRNASKREVALAKQKQKTKALHSKNSAAGSSQPPKPNVAKPSSQPQSSSSITPTAGDATQATTSTPSRPVATIRQVGLWTRFWLFLGCLSPEYTDDHH